MKCQNINHLIIFLTLMALSGYVSGQPPRVPENVVIYDEQRDFGQTCPPDFQSTQEVLDRYLKGRFGEVLIPPRELSIALDADELTMNDFVLLEDRESARICEKLNEIYAPQWQRMAWIHPDIEPMFLYDIAYYFLFGHIVVIRAGGTIIVPPPAGEERELFFMDKLGTNIIIYDDQVQQVYRHDLEYRIEQRTATTPYCCINSGLSGVLSQ